MTVLYNNTIRQKGDALRKERIAKAAITPGMLVQINSDGEFEPQAMENKPVLCAVAIEAEIWDQGRELTEPYAIGERVLVDVMMRGSEFQGLAGGSADIAIGALLTSTTDGKFQATTDPALAIGTAATAVTALAITASQGASATKEQKKAAYIIVETW